MRSYQLDPVIIEAEEEEIQEISELLVTLPVFQTDNLSQPVLEHSTEELGATLDQMLLAAVHADSESMFEPPIVRSQTLEDESGSIQTEQLSPGISSAGSPIQESYADLGIVFDAWKTVM